MDLLLASGNPHKAEELTDIFSATGRERHRVLLPADLGIRYEHEEVADTFSGNAHGKARALYYALQQQGTSEQASTLAVLADDSGLCVHALGGNPGIYSARYGDMDGSKGHTDSDRNRLLLAELAETVDRRASFVCAMVVLFSDQRFTIAQETWDGEITHEPSSGRGGFGYDPLFFVPELNCTAAELPPEEKNRRSHRGRASRVIHAVLDAHSAEA